ncbi:hypothetical protein HMI54_003986 [Coelomomyces lativittatus]|nr:hypothetical protein HMI54_003986 [Coelomomyces lativittatus]
MEGYTTFQTVEIPLHLIPIVAGRKNAEINKIMLHTKTIIYMPPPFILKNSLPLYALEDYENTISPLNMSALIFGDDENATKTAAKKILNQLKLISTTLLSQAINLGSANKRDWILKTQLDFLYEVMQKTATYFSIPPLGSDSTIVTVYGSNQEFLLKATRILARLLCEFFLARIKFSPIKESLTNEVNLLEQNQTFLQELGKIASENGSELVFNCDTISVYGTYNSLLLTCNAISELPHLSSFNFELQIESELEAEHKEFFVGKKSGKVKNITWNTSTDITLAPGISSNILVSLYANNLKDGLHAFELIRDEYPAEISFYVPEESHKRVIGIKGANIQRLTSIHKAFVRFSNAEEHKRTGGYFENEDNVIARTPVKLSHFLLSLKKEIFHPLTYAVDPSIPQELPPPEYLWHRICVSRRYHSYLLPLITPTKQLFKAQLEIPCREFGCDEVLVFCEGIYLNEIKELLLQNTPLVTQIDIPVSEAALSLISHPLFTQFLVPEIKSKFNVDLSIISSPDIENLYFLLKCDANTTADFYSAEVFFFDFLFKNNIPFQSHQSNSQMSSSIPQRYLPYFNSRVMTPWSSNRKNQNPN